MARRASRGSVAALLSIVLGAAAFAAEPAVPVKGPFAATIDGSRIVVASSLLSLLRDARLFDVVQADDVLPNQTVFVLAHLARHLDEPAMSRPQPGGLDAFIAQRLEREAQAYIEAWNASVDEAIHRRDGAALSDRQVVSLMLNSRYRFALLGIHQRNVAAPSLGPSGIIEATPSNVGAIVQTLRQSPIADIE